MMQSVYQRIRVESSCQYDETLGCNQFFKFSKLRKDYKWFSPSIENSVHYFHKLPSCNPSNGSIVTTKIAPLSWVRVVVTGKRLIWHLLLCLFAVGECWFICHRSKRNKYTTKLRIKPPGSHGWYKASCVNVERFSNSLFVLVHQIVRLNR